MKFLKVAIYSVAAIISVGVISTFYFNDTRSSFKTHAQSGANDDGITDVNIEFTNNKIYLTVTLSRPLTCSEVIKDLGITSLTVKDRTYAPRCNIVNPLLISITYEESISI